MIKNNKNSAALFQGQVSLSSVFPVFIILLAFAGNALYADEGGSPPAPVSDYARLLAGYQEQDTLSRRLALETEQAVLELEKYAVETGVAVTVSSGDTVFTFAPSGVSVSSKPGIGIQVPRLRDSSFSLDIPLQSRPETGLESYGMDLSLRVGIISRQTDTFNAGLERKKRAFVIALRNQEKRLLSREKEFCEAVKQLVTARNAMLDVQGEVFLTRLDVDQKRAGGYGSSTITLRTAELKLRSRERELQEAERALRAALEIFAENCGVEQAEIPENIPDEGLFDGASFDPDLLSEKENALWEYRINELERKAADQGVALNGKAGYSWLNTAASSGAQPSGGGFRSSVKAGADLTVPGGITASAEIAFPLEKSGEPVLTLMFVWKLSSLKTARLDSSLRTVSAQEKLLSIDEAEKKLRDLLSEYERRKTELEWRKGIYDEETELFRQNFEEQAIWYNRGIIRESDYLNAQNDYLRSVNRLLSARIDQRLYNLELQALFVFSVHEE